MLTHIRVKNFKSWRDSGEVKLAPLTGFFGTNSSGKSSLLQMLLLMKQTAERSNAEEVIFFGDETSAVNLGDFNAVVHGHKNEVLMLEFQVELSCPIDIPIDNCLVRKIDGFTFATSIRQGPEGLSVDELLYRSLDRSLDGHVDVTWRAPDRFHVTCQDRRKKVKIKNSYGVSPDNDRTLDGFTTAFEVLFSHLYYLGPTRVEPQRHYHWEGEQPEGIGQWGQNAIDALLSARIDRLTTPGKNGDVPIEERISEWLREMDLAHAFSLKRTSPRHGKNYELRIQQSPASPAVTLVDMGYGLSQFLPVLVFCYYAPEGSTLILEQPGMHLHPKVQSQLADLLIEVVTERNLQVLVESHSEHLLTRLQLRIAEEKIGADETALYFCENKAGVSKIKTLDVDELGNIKNWPPDFFGTVRGDLVKMTKAQMKRQKRTEG